MSKSVQILANTAPCRVLSVKIDSHRCTFPTFSHFSPERSAIGAENLSKGLLTAGEVGEIYVLAGFTPFSRIFMSCNMHCPLWWCPCRPNGVCPSALLNAQRRTSRSVVEEKTL